MVAVAIRLGPNKAIHDGAVTPLYGDLGTQPRGSSSFDHTAEYDLYTRDAVLLPLVAFARSKLNVDPP